MSDHQNKQKQLLQLLQKNYHKKHFQTEFFPSNKPRNPSSLVVRFYLLSTHNLSIDINFSFLSGVTQTNYSYLQIFIELIEQIPDPVISNLQYLVVKLNTLIQIGHFGIFDHPQILYFKYNQILVMDLNPGITIEIIDEVTTSILKIIGSFISVFLEVVENNKSADKALAESPLAHLFIFP